MHLSKLFLLASVPFLVSKTLSPFLSSTQPLVFLALGVPPPQPQRLVADDEGETPPAAWSRPTPQIWASTNSISASIEKTPNNVFGYHVIKTRTDNHKKKVRNLEERHANLVMELVRIFGN
ncbi:hypothetical protein GOBAR_DD36289 [Gossypium barbadense]|nr:hypothetical protein GOBAR_DD36289 [Gossypium barbadense]